MQTSAELMSAEVGLDMAEQAVAHAALEHSPDMCD
jgi:hypothetical protein